MDIPENMTIKKLIDKVKDLERDCKRGIISYEKEYELGKSYWDEYNKKKYIKICEIYKRAGYKIPKNKPLAWDKRHMVNRILE